MRLRDFSTRRSSAKGTPVLIDPPYAGHSSSIVDYAKGQSLVETLRAAGHDHVLVMDWKGATTEMKDYDIDSYLAEINVVVDDLRAPVHLVGLCQGGWMSAMYASRFPGKVRSLVLAGAPIDTNAGSGRFERWYENEVDLPGRYYLQAIEELFKANRFAKGEFIGLGRKLSLKDIKIPLYLLAGGADRIPPRGQAFAGEP